MSDSAWRRREISYASERRRARTGYLERRIGLHLAVLTVVVLAVAAALVVEGLGFALIVGIGSAVVLAAGYPLVVILAEEHDLPIARRGP